MSGYRGYIYAIGAHIGFVLLWHFAVVWSGLPAYIMPTPLEAFSTIFESSYNWGTHLWVTSLEIFSGYALAVIVGVALSVVFVWLPGVNAAVTPLLVTLNMIPKVAMAPLFIIWFSYGILPNAIIAFTICFFPIVLTTYRGLLEVDPDLLNLVKSLKANRWQIFMKIQLPGSLPYLFSGMKVAAILAVAGAIVGEFIASDRGLGNFLLIQQNALNTGAMVMALILITLIGMALYGLVLLLEWVFVTRKEAAR